MPVLSAIYYINMPLYRYSPPYIILTCRLLVLPAPHILLTCRYAGTPSTICCINLLVCWYYQHHILYYNTAMLVLPPSYVVLTCRYAGTPSTIHCINMPFAGTPNTIYGIQVCWYSQNHIWTCQYAVLATPYIDMPVCSYSLHHILTWRYAGTPDTIHCINMPQCWNSQQHILY